ncbi:30S ribosomal protein S4 [bacterium]|jgi:small subunit ribosomal protein S4|nr:30S ribosomal protein S4 [bacterium]MBT6293630.1 30S ribosomal protein S4 [bacterium]
MSTYRGPIVRKARRYGAMIFSNGKSKQNAFNKRKYAPGQHGRSSFRSMSEYAKQLQEKQKARFMFGLTEKKFRKYYKKAEKTAGITGQELLKLLERRLDNVIFRSGLAETRRQARQMSSHGIMLYNGRRVDVPSIEVKIGDTIQVRDKLTKSKLFEEVKATKKANHPKWLEVDYGKLTIKVIALPDKDDVEVMINSQAIVEFYSK